MKLPFFTKHETLPEIVVPTTEEKLAELQAEEDRGIGLFEVTRIPTTTILQGIEDVKARREELTENQLPTSSQE